MVLDCLVNTMKDFGINMDDKIFFCSIVALFALMTGNPGTALIIMIIGIM